MKKIGILLVLFSPLITFASSLEELITKAGNIIGSLIPIAISLALLFFIWGLVDYIRDTGNVEKNAEGKNRMIQGIIALFVIVSIWGIVRFISSTLGVGQDTDINIPQVPGVGSGSGGTRSSGGSGQAYEACYNNCMANGVGDPGMCADGCR